MRSLGPAGPLARGGLANYWKNGPIFATENDLFLIVWHPSRAASGALLINDPGLTNEVITRFAEHREDEASRLEELVPSWPKVED